MITMVQCASCGVWIPEEESRTYRNTIYGDPSLEQVLCKDEDACVRRQKHKVGGVVEETA